MGTIITLAFLLIAAAFAGTIAMAMRSAANRAWRFELARVLGDAFTAIGRAPILFLSTALVTSAAPLAVALVGVGAGSIFDVQSILAGLGVSVTAGFAALAIGQFGYMLMAAATLDILERGEVDLRRLFSRVLLLLPSGIIVVVLFWIAIAIGFLFFVLPALFLACLWFVATPALVAERGGAFGSFARSGQLTAGVRWHLLLLLVIGAIFWLVMQAMIGGIAAIIDDPVGSTIVYAGISALLATIPPAVTAATYYSLRTHKEGLRGDDLEQVFA